MLLGVIASLELEDASPTSAALAAISKWVDEAARREAERAQARRTRYLMRYGHVPAWVERGMGEREARVRQVRHRVQMLLGIFSARGVLPLELKPAHSVGDLLVQHLDDLEREAEEKGGSTRCSPTISPECTAWPRHATSSGRNRRRLREETDARGEETRSHGHGNTTGRPGADETAADGARSSAGAGPRTLGYL
jgi:hypothetical protein